MLTLDSGQLAKQKRQTALREQRDRAAQQIRAEIRNKEVTVARDGDLSVTSLEQQIGQPLSSVELIKRLEKMNSNLVFEVAIASPDKMGVYVIENRADPITGIVGPNKRYVTGMMRGFMPERTVRHVKKTRVPDPDIPLAWREVEEYTGETRGWRQVLKALLQERLITTHQISSLFPASANSRAWQMLTT